MSAVEPALRLPRRRRFAPAAHARPPWRRPLAIVGLAARRRSGSLIAIFAPLLAPHDPLAQDSPSAPTRPSGDYPFGTDELGRDVLRRVLCGRAPLASARLLLVGAGLADRRRRSGRSPATSAGSVDGVVMRTADLVFAFPAIILAMVVTAVLGPSLRNAVLALVVVSWPSYARVVRGLVLSVGQTEYVTGDTPARRLRPARARPRRAARTSRGRSLVLATLDLGNAVLLLAGLSFLGLGAQPPDAGVGRRRRGGNAVLPVLVDRHLSRARDLLGRPRLQLSRRQPARRARPAILVARAAVRANEPARGRRADGAAPAARAGPSRSWTGWTTRSRSGRSSASPARAGVARRCPCSRCCSCSREVRRRAGGAAYRRAGPADALGPRPATRCAAASSRWSSRTRSPRSIR